jgi:hypothetical protein
VRRVPEGREPREGRAPRACVWTPSTATSTAATATRHASTGTPAVPAKASTSHPPEQLRRLWSHLRQP